MLKSYFKIAWRNIIKSRFYSIVNVVGLTSGIVFTLVIGAYVWEEMRVNDDLKNKDQQYIIQSKWKNTNEGYELVTLGPLAKALRDNYPDLIANYYRYDGITSNVSKGDRSFREGLQVGDSTLLNMYGFKLLYGSKNALNAPFAIVITIDKAIKYFGKEDVIGQTLTIENFSGSKHNFIITGVLDKFPKNSVTNLADNYPNGMFVSEVNLAFFGRNMDWNNSSIAGYIELQKGVTPKDLEKPIAHLVKQNAPPQVATDLTPFLVPLKEYYLKANNGIVRKMIYALSSIALFILLMAVVNFINMSVSRSATRLREIGIRKVLGGLKKQLITQFLVESIILVLIATLFSVGIYAVSKNYFSDILGKQIPSFTEFPLWFVVLPFALTIAVGLLAGVYPAFVLSSLKSVDSLKGKLKTVKEKIWLRKSLVGFQFAIAAIALIGAMIVSQQVNYFFSKDLGYIKDFVVAAQVPRDWTPEGINRMENIRRQFSTLPQVSNVTLSYEVPDGNNAGQIAVYKNGSDSTQAVASQVLQCDEYYASAYGIPMAAGKFFNYPDLFTDSLSVILNETEAKTLGWTDVGNVIGKQIKIAGDNRVYTVTGVTKDFHFGSMQQETPPIIFVHVRVGTIYRFLSFKLKPVNISESIDALQKQWRSLMPGAPFEYKFMDDTLKNLYKTEIQLKQAAYTATVLALLIVLLGVLGLIALSIQKRTKEIGIRKVLGSSVAGIVVLFAREFLWIIFIAAIVACPIAYFIMQNWLSAYAYRINITVQPFFIVCLLLGFITSLLICLQTVSVASKSPADTLRMD